MLLRDRLCSSNSACLAASPDGNLCLYHTGLGANGSRRGGRRKKAVRNGNPVLREQHLGIVLKQHHRATILFAAFGNARNPRIAVKELVI